MQTKLSKLKAAWQRGDRVEALRIAAKFPRLGEHKEAIQRAWAAYQNPKFYQQIGRDPARLIKQGVEAMKERYDLEE